MTACAEDQRGIYPNRRLNAKIKSEENTNYPFRNTQEKKGKDIETKY